jgi:hypothetical protein
VLELNTSNSFVSNIAGVAVNLPPGPSCASRRATSRSSASSRSTARSSSASAAGLFIGIDGTFRVFGVSFEVAAQAQIESSGFALSTNVSLATASSFIPFAGFQISGSFRLEINTSNTTKLGISAQTFRVRVDGGLNILGIKLSGSFLIEAGPNGFRLEIPASSDHLQLPRPLQHHALRLRVEHGLPLHRHRRHLPDPRAGVPERHRILTLGHDIFSFFVSGEAGISIGPVTIPRWCVRPTGSEAGASRSRRRSRSGPSR